MHGGNDRAERVVDHRQRLIDQPEVLKQLIDDTGPLQ
jgi:hypothetical protein